jgi:hypothetical protein
MNRSWAANLIITAIGLALFTGVNLSSGRVDANDGLGWDGRQYAHMVTGQLTDGTVATQTRPLLPLLTRLPYAAGLDVLSAFQVMNFLYAAALYLCLCLVFDLYGVDNRYKAYFVATVALCIATSRMFAFYPTLLGLGSLTVLTASTYVILTRNGWPAGAAALAAVTTREFGVAVALFGFHREVRLGRGVLRPLLTYAPAIGALFLLRRWASITNRGDDRPLLSAGDLAANLALWRDPAFVMFFLYFAVTLLGGITVLLLLRPGSIVRQIAREPELATFAAPIVAVAAMGNADIWRYLIFILPVLAVLYARYVTEHSPAPLLLTGALLLTIITQQPFLKMDMMQYFRDWFPAYIHRTDDASEAFWLAWRLRIIVTVAAIAALGVIQWRHPPRQIVTSP